MAMQLREPCRRAAAVLPCKPAVVGPAGHQSHTVGGLLGREYRYVCTAPQPDLELASLTIRISTMAPAIPFLGSNQASGITGTVLPLESDITERREQDDG